MSGLDRTKSDKVFWLVFAALSALNIATLLLTPFGLAPDEAHYWDWSRHLDWSYYSKGPLIALLIVPGRQLFGDTELGVRLPAFFCYSIFSALFYFFLRRFYPPTFALVGWLALRSIVLFAQMGIVMTTDGPAALFWMLGLICAYLAVVEEQRAYWIFFGLAIGLGIDAKYTVFFLFISVVLYLLFNSQLRNHLRSWQFWAGAVLQLLIVAPIIYWNARHDWVNFEHNAGHVVKSSAFSMSARYFPELILGQLGLVGPILFPILCIVANRGVRVWRNGDLVAGLFMFSSVPLALFIAAISLTKRVYPNWPMPIYIGALFLLVHLLSQRQFGNGRMRRWLKAGIILSGTMTLLAHIVFLGATLGLPGKLLPTKKLFGWQELGRIISAQLPPGERRFVMGDDYEIAAEIGFYTQPHAETYCAALDDRRMNQYDIWGGLPELKGRDGLIISISPERIETLQPHFASLEPLGPQPAYVMDFHGHRLRDLYLYLGKNYDGSVPEVSENR